MRPNQPYYLGLTTIVTSIILSLYWSYFYVQRGSFYLSFHRECEYSESQTHHQSYFSAVSFVEKDPDRVIPSSLKYKFCSDHVTSESLFGDYFNAMGCAHISGIDFMVDGSAWPAIPFLSMIPRVVRHPSPTLSVDKAIAVVRSKCQICKGSCWKDPKAPWIHALPLVKKHLYEAAVHHIRHINKTKINLLTDRVSVDAGTILPVIPDVSVQYQCADNTFENEFTTFDSITKLIPANSKYVYILSDPLRLSDSGSAYSSSRCGEITSALYDHVVTAFPCAVVLLKRSGDRFIDFSRYTLSKVTICSSSSSCFWPGLANRNTVYFPPTLTMGGATTASRPRLSASVRYLIDAPKAPFPPNTPVSDILSSLRGEDENIGSRHTTVVTGYFRVSSKYDHGTYDKWLAIFMKMGFRVLIYCDEDSKGHLEKQHPQTEDRVYVLRPFSSFSTSEWDWKSDETLDPEKNVGHNAALYQIWNEKVFMVADAAEKNIFKTETFAWVDIGCFREENMLPYFKGFPDNTKFDHSKVTFLQINPFTISEKKNVFSPDSRFIGVNRIGGGMFAGGGEAILRFRSIFRKIITDFKEKKIFAGKDQSLFAFSILQNPSSFATVDPIPSDYDYWMILHLMWASSARATKSSCSKAVAPVVKSTPQCEAFFLILSTPQSRPHRDAIRAGWLSDFGNLKSAMTFKYRFVMGREKNMQKDFLTQKILAEEMRLYGDILVLPFIDDSSNITVKVGLMLKWPTVVNECKYIVKSDEDVHIKARKFTAMLRSLPDIPLYSGHVYGQLNGTSGQTSNQRSGYSQGSDQRSDAARGLRDSNSPPYISSTVNFDPYAGGPVYFMTSTVAKNIPYEIAEFYRKDRTYDKVPDTYLNRPLSPLFKQNDAFLGHLIGQMDKKDVTLWHIRNFFASATSVTRSAIAIHGINDPRMLREAKQVFG